MIEDDEEIERPKEPAGYLRAVKDWMNAQHAQRHVAEVIATKTHATDWAGSTFEGFHSEFDLTIDYIDKYGQRRSENISGEELERLWMTVVAGYPVEAPVRVTLEDAEGNPIPVGTTPRAVTSHQIRLQDGRFLELRWIEESGAWYLLGDLGESYPSDEVSDRVARFFEDEPPLREKVES